MKRIFKIMVSVLCLGAMLFAFTACSQNKGTSNENANVAPIVGKWEYEDSSDMYYTFNEDGTGSYYFVSGEMKFTYEDDGEAVTLHYETATEPSTYKYTIKDNVLSIEDSFGEYVTYIKK
ncbi:MAG: hypothetical protein II997_03125 [Clostridia bacterium]|nr:hypothetical protein [Clostridia bacterium]